MSHGNYYSSNIMDTPEETAKIEEPPKIEDNSWDGLSSQPCLPKSLDNLEPDEFENDFWFTKNYQKILEIHLTGHNFSDEFVKMMQERVQIHYNYTTSLNSWQEKWRNALLRQSESELLPGVKWSTVGELKHYKKSTLLSQQLIGLLMFIEEEGRLNLRVLKRLENSVAYPVSSMSQKNYAKSLNTGETFYETNKTDMETIRKSWCEKYEKMMLCKMSYRSAQEEYSKRVNKLLSKLGDLVEKNKLYDESVNSKENYLPESVSKDKKLQKLAAHKESAFKSYRVAYDELISYSPIYEKTMRNICEEFVQKENNLRETVISVVSEYAHTILMDNKALKLDLLSEFTGNIDRRCHEDKMESIKKDLGFEKPLIIEPFEETYSSQKTDENAADINATDKKGSNTSSINKLKMKSVKKLTSFMKKSTF